MNTPFHSSRTTSLPGVYPNVKRLEAATLFSFPELRDTGRLLLFPLCLIPNVREEAMNDCIDRLSCRLTKGLWLLLGQDVEQ
jgi:hypothetical protein